MVRKIFTVVVEQDEDGWYVAKVPDIQGCSTQGKNINEVIDRVKEAIRVCIESEKDAPEPLKFVVTKQVEVSI